MMAKLRTFARKNELQQVRAQDFEWVEFNESALKPETLEHEEGSAESEEEVEGTSLPVRGDWVITTGALSRKCLHVVGNCFCVPSVHYNKLCIVYDPVGSSEFRSACRSCFPCGYPLVTASAQEQCDDEVEDDMPKENELEITSSSSSSASSAEAEV